MTWLLYAAVLAAGYLLGRARIGRRLSDWAAWQSVGTKPTGWHKRPTVPVRRAPRRDEHPDYNRPRCVHGCYLHDGCRTINCPDQEGR